LFRLDDLFSTDPIVSEVDDAVDVVEAIDVVDVIDVDVAGVVDGAGEAMGNCLNCAFGFFSLTSTCFGPGPSVCWTVEGEGLLLFG